MNRHHPLMRFNIEHGRVALRGLTLQEVLEYAQRTRRVIVWETLTMIGTATAEVRLVRPL